MKILVTGIAGFIGYHTASKLLHTDCEIVGIDNLNTYYDINLKIFRLNKLGFDHNAFEPGLTYTSKNYKNLKFIRIDITNKDDIKKIFSDEGFSHVVHLAAQAGVRFSIEKPDEYMSSNITGFFNILEACRLYPVEHLIYASSSSVYGNKQNILFRESDKANSPISLYAATKKCNELMAYSYSNLYEIPTTGLRFFTVYGAWGRPDMAYFKFAESILNNSPIFIYNNGEMKRDFTYIDDVTESIYRLLPKSPISKITSSKSLKKPPYRILNIGCGSPVNLAVFVEEIEKNLKMKANKIYLELQPGDVLETYADTIKLEKLINFKPKIDIEVGVKIFCEWFLKYKNSD